MNLTSSGADKCRKKLSRLARSLNVRSTYCSGSPMAARSFKLLISPLISVWKAELGSVLIVLLNG